MHGLLVFLILLDTAHVLSPFVLSWTHSGFRGVMLGTPVKYMAPALIVGAAGLFLPIPALVNLYWAANFYHFAMQNFGVLQLVCPARRVNLSLAFAGTAAGIWFIPLAISAHHFLTDVGLSWRASGSRQWIFVGIVFSLVMLAWFCDPRLTLVAASPLRLCLGLSHFAASARIWKLSDPQVRATIGKELFA